MIKPDVNGCSFDHLTLILWLRYPEISKRFIKQLLLSTGPSYLLESQSAYRLIVCGYVQHYHLLYPSFRKLKHYFAIWRRLQAE